jgi:hypothetical protein
MSSQRVGLVSAIALLLAILTIGLASCDAEKDALKLFSDQGLNLLRPARDYIRPGGMVFLVKGAPPEYDDPKDPVTPETGNLTDFKAVILAETKNKTGAFSAALSLAKSIIPTPLSFGAGAESSRDVKLKQIETTGQRLKTDPLDDLIKKPKTSQAAVSAIQGGKRVFIVQEIYKATSLDLQATDTKAMNIKFNDGSAPVNCKPSTQPAQKDSSGTPPSKQDNSGSGNAGKDTGSQGSGAATSKKPEGASGAASKSKVAPQTGSAKSGAGTADNSSQSGASTVSGAVGVCVAEDFSLQFQTKDPIPFAVRLAELELAQGVLQRRIGAKTFVATLGGGGKISGSLIDDSAPVVEGLPERKH